jgi:hypothetical protein
MKLLSITRSTQVLGQQFPTGTRYARTTSYTANRKSLYNPTPCAVCNAFDKSARNLGMRTNHGTGTTGIVAFKGRATSGTHDVKLPLLPAMYLKT